MVSPTKNVAVLSTPQNSKIFSTDDFPLPKAGPRKQSSRDRKEKKASVLTVLPKRTLLLKHRVAKAKGKNLLTND